MESALSSRELKWYFAGYICHKIEKLSKEKHKKFHEIFHSSKIILKVAWGKVAHIQAWPF